MPPCTSRMVMELQPAVCCMHKDPPDAANVRMPACVRQQPAQQRGREGGSERGAHACMHAVRRSPCVGRSARICGSGVSAAACTAGTFGRSEARLPAVM